MTPRTDFANTLFIKVYPFFDGLRLSFSRIISLSRRVFGDALETFFVPKLPKFFLILPIWPGSNSAMHESKEMK